MRRASHPSPTVAIIGAGFAGIAAAVALKRAGIHSFTVYERGDGVGGTWWHNRYPGAEVDTPSLLYSFSFQPWVWTRTHVRRAELQHYMEAVLSRFELWPHLRMSTEVVSARWDEQARHYDLSGPGDRPLGSAQIIVSAVGFLNDPKYPEWPGLETFRGPSFHTARWEAQHDLTGKRVAVVGSGSTATQVVPGIAGIADTVLMFQREPGWIVPKGDRAFTARERQALHSPVAQRIARSKMIFQRERFQIGAATFRPGTPQNAAAEQAALRLIDAVFAERPDLAKSVTPDYPYGGKRPIITDAFYPVLLRDNVRLVPHAVVAVTETGVIDATGGHHDVDVLVLATGFRPADYLSTLDVLGRDGRSLREAWQGEPAAFLGMMVPGFPNFFMMYGPNTNGGAIVTMLELEAAYIKAAARRLRRGAATIEVRDRPYRWFNEWLAYRMSGTVWETFANNYYKSPSGRIVTQWPDGVLPYGVLTTLLRRPVWKVR